MAMTPDASCVAVERYYGLSVAAWIQAFLAACGAAIGGTSGTTLLGTYLYNFGSRPTLRTERAVSGVGTYANDQVLNNLWWPGGATPTNINADLYLRDVGPVMDCRIVDETHTIGSPDSLLAVWSTLVVPTLQAMLTQCIHQATVAYTAETEYDWTGSAVRWLVATFNDRAMIGSQLVTAHVYSKSVAGNVTVRTRQEPSPGAAGITIAGVQGVQAIADGVTQLAQQDVDVALNSGGVIYSVRSKELTEE